MNARFGYRLIEEALKGNKIYDLFIGQYKMMQSPHASVPTDSIYIFDCWVLYVNKSNNKEDLWKTFADIIIKISNDEEMSWFSLYYVLKLVSFMENSSLEFIDVKSLIIQVRYNIESKYEVLKSDYRWVGHQGEYSLWDDCNRIFNILSERYSIQFNSDY